MIQNPILRGFNADPSICRVGKDYYIATSTFEWYPGVQIHHSTDLVNWRLITRPLRRASQLDMRGNPDSCGIWAPCLSHAGGLFWLVYTDVKRLDGDFKDAHNYIVTCPRIDGDWSEPVYVNSSGFDPSLFHDTDGRKWVLNMRWNHGPAGSGVNPANDRFDGIEMQEWHPQTGLTGPIHNIYPGTDLGLTEAPHLFKRDGWYYLTVAEGGTGYDHAVTMARACSITGPYETHPNKHVMTARFDPQHPLQRVGHGQYVEAEDGTPYHSYLCGRPQMGPKGRFCATGRETGLARCVWGPDGWLYLADGGFAPPVALAVQAPHARTASVHRCFAQMTALPSEFQWLRTPYPERLFRLTGHALRLTGRESIGSLFEQSLVARRQEEADYDASADLICDPPNFQRAAGLVTYYNRHKFHALWITRDAKGERIAQIVSCLGDWQHLRLNYGASCPIPEGRITLSVQVRGARQQFLWAADGKEAKMIGAQMDASIISDEGGIGEHGSFTGAFVGMFAMDVTGRGWGADFLSFDYTNRSFGT